MVECWNGGVFQMIATSSSGPFEFSERQIVDWWIGWIDEQSNGEMVELMDGKVQGVYVRCELSRVGRKRERVCFGKVQ